MASYKYKFLGRESLPPRMTEAEAEELCSLLPEQIAQIPKDENVDDFGKRKRGRPRQILPLGYAVQLALLALTGRHGDPSMQLPPAMLKLYCRQLGVDPTAIATLRSIYRNKALSERSLREHRAWARRVLGFELFDASHQQELKSALEVRARDAAARAELFSFAEEWLHEKKVVLPGVTTLEDMAGQAFQFVENLALQTVHAAIKPTRLRAILKHVFEEGQDPGTTVLEWLKQSAGKHGVKALDEVSSRVEYLKTLGAHEWDLSALSPTRIQAFAQRVVHRPPSEVARRTVETQSVEIICFLKHTLSELTDEAIFRANRRASDLVRQGNKRVQSKQASRSIEYREHIRSMRALATDSTKTYKERVLAVIALADSVLAQPAISHASVVRETLTEQGERVRTILRDIDCLDIEGDPQHRDIELVQALKQLQKDKVKELPANFDVSAVDPVWKPLVEDPDRKRALQAFQGCALMRIRKGLLGGRLWVSHSASYRSRDDCLIPKDEWVKNKKTICDALGLETDPRIVLRSLYAMLDDGLAKLDGAVDKGLVEIDDQGTIRIPRLRAAEDEPELKRTLQAVQDMSGPVQLPDLILSMDAQTRFSAKLLGRDPEDAIELISVYAGLLASGSDVDAKTAAAMIPGVTVAQVTAAMRMLEGPGRLRAANDAIVAFQQRFPVVRLWGDGTKASSDMMSLDATRHLGIARMDPKRRTMAAGIYTHVLGSYPIVHDTPIVLMTRQTGPAVEGVERYNAAPEDRIKIQILAVDTHGFTYPGMALAKLLKFDLCPQLAGLPDRKLWLTRKMKVPEGLDRVAFNTVSERAIVGGWDQMLRLVASVLTGRVSVSWALARNGSAAAGDRLYRALDQYGRLLRTLFLCDYFANDDFRREIHTLLNRGESVHQLQRAIHSGRIAPERGRRRDELKAISGAHVLLTNLVIAWNTQKLQDLLDRLKAGGQQIADDLVRRMGPVFFGNINFRGTMSFGIERYADVLLKPRRRAPEARSA